MNRKATLPPYRGSGSVLLGRWPLPLLRIACEKCGRYGQYHTAKLLERLGPDYPLAVLLEDVAANCERRKARKYDDQCRASFVDAVDVANGRIPRS
jgi:hypothetical protein